MEPILGEPTIDLGHQLALEGEPEADGVAVVDRDGNEDDEDQTCQYVKLQTY